MTKEQRKRRKLIKESIARIVKKQREERFADLYAKIEDEVEFVGIKPYSSNIISCNLRIIWKEFGYNKTNEVIDELGLTSLGWKHSYKDYDNDNNSKVRSSKMNNRNRKNWTNTDLIKLTRMYRSGRLTVAQIADRLGRTYFAVVKQAQRMCLAYKNNYRL